MNGGEIYDERNVWMRLKGRKRAKELVLMLFSWLFLYFDDLLPDTC